MTAFALQTVQNVELNSHPVLDGRLTDILESSKLPTPPAVAMRIVQMTTLPDCGSSEISEMLRQDPGICAQVLKAINSCIYGFSTPITSIERAVVLLGLNTVRSIVLTLTLPAMQFTGVPDRVMREHWLSSVTGAIIARELTVRMREPLAEDDLLCGLLRDLGSLVLRQRFPAECQRVVDGMIGKPFKEYCRHERDILGVDHAQVSAELLLRWRLPPAITEPIRFHHEPSRMVGFPPELVARAERLAFVVSLTNLDQVAQNPAEVDALLKTAETRYGLSQSELIEFLQKIVPKVDAFTALISTDVGRTPDFAATLAMGCGELVKLTVQSGRVSMPATHRTPPATPDHAATLIATFGDADFEIAQPVPSDAQSGHLPPLTLGHVDSFPTSGCRLGGFELHKELGRGAMGVVYQATEISLNRTVAIKLLAPELTGDKQFRVRFLREARNVASIRHDNVIGIYGVWDQPPFSYFAMEYVDGKTLEDLIQREHPVPLERICEIALQLASGLAAAHAQRIVHRDLKPANVLVEQATGRVKLTDFGLARGEHDAKLTAVGDIVGSPHYMSPEQAAGKPEAEDARSDLFSLGAVFYTLTTCRPPFTGPSIPAILLKVCRENPIPIKELRTDMPKEFWAIVRKLMAKQPQDRFASADAVVDALRSINGARTSNPGKWRRWLGR